MKTVTKTTITILIEMTMDPRARIAILGFVFATSLFRSIALAADAPAIQIIPPSIELTHKDSWQTISLQNKLADQSLSNVITEKVEWSVDDSKIAP